MLNRYRPASLPVTSLLAVVALACCGAVPAFALDPQSIERDLVLRIDGKEQRADLDAALALLDIPSASLAVIDEGRIAFAKAYGDATTDTLYQAASLSKFVTAIGAMRLVQQGTLDLDTDVRNG